MPWVIKRAGKACIGQFCGSLNLFFLDCGLPFLSTCLLPDWWLFLVILWKLSLWWQHVPWEQWRSPKQRNWVCTSLCSHDPLSVHSAFPLFFSSLSRQLVGISDEKIIVLDDNLHFLKNPIAVWFYFSLSHVDTKTKIESDFFVVEKGGKKLSLCHHLIVKCGL